MVYDTLNLSKEQFQSLFHATKLINTTERFKNLLNKIMDIAIESVGAERGFIVLKDNTGGLNVKVARNIDQSDIGENVEISFSAIKNVVEGKDAIITTNAKKDPRLKDASSIMLYNIVSIIAVPLLVKGDIIGAIYLDTRTSNKVFTDAHLEFLKAFSEIAAIAIENVHYRETIQKENILLKQRVGEKYSPDEIVGKSKKMQEIMEIVSRVSTSDIPVLLEGESGTGKELIARTIHYSGLRKNGKFVPVYCGGFPENLLESELFGYKKGAFTGAVEHKAGLFEEADGGTFFLDEIGEVPVSVQVKLLRVLEEGRFRRLGETKERQVDVRVISATNKELLKLVQEGKFREDLYYRIKVVKIFLPPLRQRKGDIPLLAHHFVRRYSSGSKNISKKVIQIMMEYPWPGNIRELENVISYAVVMSRGDEITEKDLPSELLQGTDSNIPESLNLNILEAQAIKNALRLAKNNKSLAAKALGISKRTLLNKIKHYEIFS